MIGWFVAGFNLLRWAGGRLNDLTRQKHSYTVLKPALSEEQAVPASVLSEMTLRKAQADAGWLRVAVLALVLTLPMAAIFGLQWKANAHGVHRWKARYAETQKTLDRALAANRDFDVAFRGAKAEVARIRMDCLTAIDNGKERALKDLNARAASKKERVANVFKSKKPKAGDVSSLPDADDFLRAFAQSAPSGDQATPAPAPGN